MSVEPAPPVLKFATPGTSAPSTHASLLSEMEHVLTSLTSHRSVLGYMVLSRAHPVTIIGHSGVVFEGEQGRKYAQCISRIAQSVQTGLQEVSGDPDDTDEVRFVRIRTRRHELMVSPDDRYLLAVLHDPTS